MTEVEQWRSWLAHGGAIQRDLLLVLLRRDVWEGMREVLTADPERLPNSYFWQYLTGTYADAQVIAVRRLTDNTKGTENLRKLLEKLSQRPQLITVDEWVKHPGVSRLDWDRSFGEPVNGCVDRTFVRGVLDRMKTAAQAVHDFANSYTAHASASPSVTELQWVDLDAAIDAIREAYDSCLYLVSGALWYYGDPLTLGWDAVFDVPWRATPKWQSENPAR